MNERYIVARKYAEMVLFARQFFGMKLSNEVEMKCCSDSTLLKIDLGVRVAMN